MTLYINGRFLTQPMSGVQRYAKELVAAFDDLLAQRSGLRRRLGPVQMLTPFATQVERNSFPRYQHIEIITTGVAHGHIWEQSRLYQASKDGVLLSLGNSGPLAHERHVVAFHDAHIFEMPEAFAKGYGRWHRILRPRLAKRAAGLITVSRHSAQRLAHFLNVDAGRFDIVPNAAEHLLRVAENPHVFQSYGLQRRGYLLTVGNQSPNKNLDRLVAAHQEAGSAVPPLVVVGDAPDALSKSTVVGGERLRVLGRVPDRDLRALYLGATGFVFPSLNEGFGIPPLEAMQLGVPVLSSNSSAMPEVLGQAPLWFDPKDQADMSFALQRFTSMSKRERQRRITLGLSQAARYSWRASAEVLVEGLSAHFMPVARSALARTSKRALVSARSGER